MNRLQKLQKRIREAKERGHPYAYISFHDAMCIKARNYELVLVHAGQLAVATNVDYYIFDGKSWSNKLKLVCHTVPKSATKTIKIAVVRRNYVVYTATVKSKPWLILCHIRGNLPKFKYIEQLGKEQ